MEEGTIILLVGILTIAVSVTLLAIARKVAKSACDPSLCIAYTEGTVIGGAPIIYAGHRTARVRYEVGGRTYEVNGPLFAYGSSGAFMKSNLTTRDNLPKAIKGPIPPGYSSSHQEISGVTDVSYEQSLIATLYPIGSPATVWYNPSDPSMAYVERFVKSFAPLLLTAIGVPFLIIGVGVTIFALVSL